MSDQLQFGEEQSRAVEATYATQDVVRQRRATLAALAVPRLERREGGAPLPHHVLRGIGRLDGA